MNHELAMLVQSGQGPAECYRVPDTVAALVKTIEELQSGGTIRADRPHGSGFAFGRTSGGRWAFATDEFLDGDERTPNPDFHQATFDTVADGVRTFTINGRGLFECVKGCRIFQDDAPNVYPDFTYQDYVRRFGDPSKVIDELPWQISPACAHWREPFANVVEHDPRLSVLFSECAERGKAITALALVDALYLSADGSYTFHEVKARDYDDFMRRVSKLKFEY